MGQNMKLLDRSSRYYLFFSLLIFAVVGLVLYFALRITLIENTEESLRHTRPALVRQLLPGTELLPTMYIMDEVVEFQPIPRLTAVETYRDTLILTDQLDGELEWEPYRKYTYDELIRGKPYRVSISLSTVEKEDLILTLLFVVLGGLLLFLVAINLLNRYLSRQLWLPFYRTLKEIKQFSVRQKLAPAFPPSETIEFDDLNRGLEAMTGQLIGEYDSLRRFTENASHEIQTPLAIIRNHVDLLLRGPERSELDYGHLQRISESVSRLSKLNRSLLLLTRIEHDQFPEAVRLDPEPLLRDKLAQLAPLLAEKRIALTVELEPGSMFLPQALADVLLNNLLGNAIRHNIPEGKLDVVLGGRQLTITNTGPASRLDNRVIFDRFRKAGNVAESLGLGLAIVKEICDKYGLEIAYEQQDGLHRMTVNF